MQQHDTATDEHAHRNLDELEAPLDAANQSLADALKASFSILKGIMLVLVVLFLISNIRRVESHEQALLIRLGTLEPKVYDAGLVKAFPFPIDEVLTLPTQKSNELTITSHSFHRRPEEIGKPLSFISRGSAGLDPSLDGALLTADAGLVHVQWKVVYKIDHVRDYVSNIASKKLEAAESLIQTMVENAGIHVAAGMTAEEVIRTKVDEVQSRMKQRVNASLSAIDSGIRVDHIEMAEPTPPIPVRAAFDNTQRAENTKQKRIDNAEQAGTKLLNETAGSAYKRVIAALDKVEAGEAGARDELDNILMTQVEGRAGRMIKDAGSYLSVVLGRIQSDVELYRTLVPEFERSPEILVGRLWEDTRQRIFSSPGVTKIWRPIGAEIRLKIPYDRRQGQKEEAQELLKKEFDPSKLLPEKIKIVGPDLD